MNFTTDKGQSKAGQLGLAVAGALLLGLFTAVATSTTGLAEMDNRIAGGGSPGGGEGGGGGGGGFAADDEFIGTLPTRGDDDQAPLPPVTAPGFFLAGPRSETMGAVLGSTGTGYASVEVITAGGGADHQGPHPADIIEVTFYGPVEVSLDAGLMSSPNVQMGLNSSNPVGDTYTVALTDEELLLETVISANANLSMDLAGFANAGFLHTGIHVLTSSRQYGRDQINMSAFGGVLQISQGNALGQ